MYINTIPKEDLVFPRTSDAAVVLGNGPSIIRYMSDIEWKYSSGAVTFGVNRIFMLNLMVPINYYVAPDRDLWIQEIKAIHKLHCQRYFVPECFRKWADINRLMTFGYHDEDPFHFATKWGEGMGHGHTCVFIALQLAVMSGAK